MRRNPPPPACDLFSKKAVNGFVEQLTVNIPSSHFYPYLVCTANSRDHFLQMTEEQADNPKVRTHNKL